VRERGGWRERDASGRHCPEKQKCERNSLQHGQSPFLSTPSQSTQSHLIVSKAVIAVTHLRVSSAQGHPAERPHDARPFELQGLCEEEENVSAAVLITRGREMRAVRRRQRKCISDGAAMYSQIMGGCIVSCFGDGLTI
jgi:hypothetical protein